MSEYQYYRFVSLDNPLSSAQQNKLREISSRASISANAFQVYYNYSDLNADPDKLMKDYFDIGFYYANWGDVTIWLKLPPSTLPKEFLIIDDGYTAVAWSTKKYQLLRLSLEGDEDYRDDEDAEAFFIYLHTLRDELINGDYRLLYLCWLNQLDQESKPSELPRIGFDFNQLTEGQQAFADLFSLSQVSIKALEKLLSETKSHKLTTSGRFSAKQQLEQLSTEDKDRLLYALFEQGQLSRHQALAMLNQTQVKKEWCYWLSADDLTPYCRQIKDEMRQQYLAVEAKRKEEERLRREWHLTAVFEAQDRYWQAVVVGAEKRNASGYSEAERILQDLYEAYQLKGVLADFVPHFQDFISAYSRRSALMKRLEPLKQAVAQAVSAGE